MKNAIFILSALLCSTPVFCTVPTPIPSYQSCLTSLREDGNVMISEIENAGRIVYQKKSAEVRDLFLINDSKMYSCGELSMQNINSTPDVLNYDIILNIDEKKFSLLVEIPSDLTFEAEDVIFRESENSRTKENLICNMVGPETIDPAFVETVGSRLKSFSLMFKESVENKKNQERSHIWGVDWKAKASIDQERNGYLRVIKNCADVSALNTIRIKVKNELMSIK